MRTTATTTSDLVTAPIAWTSDDPHLSGNFAPIGPEIDAADLAVVAGRIPPGLRGAYMRNGPNPLFRPITYSYPMDGDGMVHAVFFDNGRARYRNRFVRTKGLAVERRAGRAVYGGLMRPVPPDPALVGPDGDPGPIKNGTFINVLRHGGQLLALGEASTAYAMTEALDTIGEWKAGTDAPILMGAHNRRHPRTGSLFALSYAIDRPVVTFHEIDATGRLARSFTLPLAAPTMIHDFILTEHHLVLLAGPAVFDMQAAAEGKPMLQWRPELGTRIAVMQLDGSAPVWFEAEAFFVFHFANGFERGGGIVIDHVRHDRLKLGYTPPGAAPPRLRRLVLDLGSRTLRDEALAGFTVEFPRVNDALEALPTRFVYVPTLTESLLIPNPPPASFNTILKVDTDSGTVTRHDLGNRLGGEPVFIPRGGTAEDDGYLAVFAFDPQAAGSDLVLLDAAHIEDAPVAVIRMPQRVPQGLHGNWMPR